MELRAYFFNNMYLSSIQAGIQSQHTTAEMFVKYLPFDHKCSDTLYDWAIHYKTTIVLNGGMQSELQEILSLLQEKNNPYPFAFFKEAEYSLNGALTNVGIILPERIYHYSKHYKKAEAEGWLASFNWTLTEWEARFVEVLSSKRLMN